MAYFDSDVAAVTTDDESTDEDGELARKLVTFYDKRSSENSLDSFTTMVFNAADITSDEVIAHMRSQLDTSKTSDDSQRVNIDEVMFIKDPTLVKFNYDFIFAKNKSWIYTWEVFCTDCFSANTITKRGLIVPPSHCPNGNTHKLNSEYTRLLRIKNSDGMIVTQDAANQLQNDDIVEILSTDNSPNLSVYKPKANDVIRYLCSVVIYADSDIAPYEEKLIKRNELCNKIKLYRNKELDIPDIDANRLYENYLFLEAEIEKESGLLPSKDFITLILLQKENNYFMLKSSDVLKSSDKLTASVLHSIVYSENTLIPLTMEELILKICGYSAWFREKTIGRIEQNTELYEQFFKEQLGRKISLMKSRGDGVTNAQELLIALFNTRDRTHDIVFKTYSKTTDTIVELPAHKCILAASSKYFSIMFSNKNFSELKTGMVDLTSSEASITSETLAEIFRFIYCSDIHVEKITSVGDFLFYVNLYELDQLKKEFSVFL